MYDKTNSIVKWKGFISTQFCDIMGVAQGGISSPYLFRNFLKDLQDALILDLGVCISDKLLTHLLWADDLFMVSSSAPNMQCQMGNLEKYCSTSLRSKYSWGQ